MLQCFQFLRIEYHNLLKNNRNIKNSPIEMFKLVVPRASKKMERIYVRVVRPSVRDSVRHAFLCIPYLMNRACKGFEISYVASSWTNSWSAVFGPSYVPFRSYAPLKKSEWNLISKLSRNVFKLGILKLCQLIGDAGETTWLTFDQILSNVCGVMALCEFGHFKFVSKVSQKLFDLGAWHYVRG